MKEIKLVLIVVALLLMGFFIFQNLTVVQVEFLFWRLEASRALIYLLTFMIGFLTGWLGRSMARWK